MFTSCVCCVSLRSCFCTVNIFQKEQQRSPQCPEKPREWSNAFCNRKLRWRLANTVTIRLRHASGNHTVPSMLAFELWSTDAMRLIQRWIQSDCRDNRHVSKFLWCTLSDGLGTVVLDMRLIRKVAYFEMCHLYTILWPVEEFQIWNMKFAKMGVQDLNFGFVKHVAHALLWSSGGVGGGVITFLTSIIHGARNSLPLCTKKVLLGLQLDMASKCHLDLPCWSLWSWRCRKHFGTEASRRE